MFATLYVPAAAAQSGPTLTEVWQQNNRFRAKVANECTSTSQSGNCWIDQRILAGSVFNYGIPRKTRLSTFNAINAEPTLHDLVTWLGAHTVARSGRGLSYLEIGVSSLKNFDIQVNYFRDNASTLAAMDIEDPNPKRASTWGEPVVVRAIPSRRFNSPETRATFKGMLKVAHRTAHPCVRNFSLCEDRTLLWPTMRDGRQVRMNTVVYDTMDQMDSEAWVAFAETRSKTLGLPPLDLVFSDGLHTQAAVTKEHHELMQLGLLLAPKRGRDFTMVWDDCFVTPAQKRRAAHKDPKKVGDAVVGQVAPAIAAYLKGRLPGKHSRKFCFVTFRMATWVALDPSAPKSLNEVCLLTTLDISSLLTLPPNTAYGGLGGQNCTTL